MASCWSASSSTLRANGGWRSYDDYPARGFVGRESLGSRIKAVIGGSARLRRSPRPRQAEADAQFRPGRDSPTIEQWGRVWLSDYARESPGTRLVYKQAVKTITGSIGALRLGGVDRPTAHASLLANGRATSRTLRCIDVGGRETRPGHVTDNHVCRLASSTITRTTRHRGLDRGRSPRARGHCPYACHGDYGPEARADRSDACMRRCAPGRTLRA